MAETNKIINTEDLEQFGTDFKGKLASVAVSGEYSALNNKPSLATVATSGSYNDLSNKPSLATVATSGSYNDLSNKPSLATVATSGSYNDLSNKPTIPDTSSFVKKTGDSMTGMLNVKSINISDINNLIMVAANSTTTGSNCVLFGKDLNSIHNQSVAIGRNITEIYNSDQISIGQNISQNNNHGVLIGHDLSTGNIKQGIVLGYNNNINANCGIIIGDENSIGYLCNYGIAIGGGAYINGISTTSIAIGTSAEINNNSPLSIAIGRAASVVNSPSSIALGNDAEISNSSNTIQLGWQYIKSLKCKVSITTGSDIRDKTDIVPIPHAIDFLNALEAFTYVRNERSLYEKAKEDLTEEELEIKHKYGFIPYDKEAHAAATKKGERRRSGFSAQQVREAMGKIYGDESYANLINDDLFNHKDVPEGVESHLGVQYELFVPFIVRAIQELSEENTKLKQRITQLEEVVA